MTENTSPKSKEPNGEPAARQERDALQRAGRILLMRGGPFVALGLLVAYMSIASPNFLTVGNLANIGRQSAITGILAVGQTAVILSAGIDLSVGAMAALAASASAVMMTSQFAFLGTTIGPLPFTLGLPLALLVGMLAGAFNGFVISKGRIPDFIATLGTFEAFRGLALLITQGLPVPSHLTATELRGQLPDPMLWMGGGKVFGVPVPALIGVGTVVLGWLLLRYTVLGRATYAVGGNREAARVSGINIDRTKIAVYTFSGLMAGLGGFVLAGRLNSANALMASGQELTSIAAVVIGGTNLFGGEGGVFGTLIGALVIGVLANGLNLLNVSEFWQRVFQGGVVIVVVIFDQWRRRRFRG
ncbi:MAG: ABC transporter permease [Anaerolineales bacterium]